jgi:peptidoglycan/LPS O-acetylase OafA/YrhL
MAVVFDHCWPEGPSSTLWWWLTHVTPLSVARDGRASVILFFVLSGFALSLAVEGDAPFSYTAFLVRRFCRIYLPFAAAILLAFLLCWLLVRGPVPGMGEQFNSYWTVDLPSLQTLRNHLLMLGRRPDTLLDVPVWSLAHELRISLIFPLLYLAQRRVPALPAAAAALSVAVAFAYGAVGGDIVPLYASTVRGSIEPTAYHLVFFTFGIATAQHRHLVLRLVSQGRWALWLAVLLAFSLRWPSRLATDLQYGVGSTLAIWLVATSPRATRLMEAPALQWLGRVSYSLYLTHVILLLTVVHALYQWIEPTLVAWSVPVLSLAVAAGFHALVEAPSIRLARTWAARLPRPRGRAISAIGAHGERHSGA